MDGDVRPAEAMSRVVLQSFSYFIKFFDRIRNSNYPSEKQEFLMFQARIFEILIHKTHFYRCGNPDHQTSPKPKMNNFTVFCVNLVLS